MKNGCEGGASANALEILLGFYTQRNLPSLPNSGGFATRSLMQEDVAYESTDLA
ncbi:hypothetical protein N9B60_05585 [Mariniblastus sp.]|nr:hypothetical protein [Mariniblastus sp.]